MLKPFALFTSPRQGLPETKKRRRGTYWPIHYLNFTCCLYAYDPFTGGIILNNHLAPRQNVWGIKKKKKNLIKHLWTDMMPKKRLWKSSSLKSKRAGTQLWHVPLIRLPPLNWFQRSLHFWFCSLLLGWKYNSATCKHRN